MPRTEYQGTVTVQKQLSKRTEEKDYYRFSLVIPQDLANALRFEGGEELKAWVHSGRLCFERADGAGEGSA